MIAETSAWLTWALDHDLDASATTGWPRIPRRRVDLGGFGNLIHHPGARAAVHHWWMKTLGVVHNVSEKFGL
jgi:hypothetical protein